MTTVYRVHFVSADAASRARRALEAQGFAVQWLAPDEARSAYALDATIAGSEADASSRLDAALLTIDHDPVIEYHVAGIDSFTE